MIRRLSSRAPWVWPAVIFAVAALLPLATWYRGQPLIWGIDSVGPLAVKDIGQYFSLPDAGLGSPDARKLPFALPWGSLLWLWNWLGLPYSPVVAQRLLVSGLTLTSSILAAALTRRVLARVSTLTAVGAGLFYTFNLYSLTSVWTPMSNLVFHYSLLPGVLLAWLAMLRKPTALTALRTGLVWALLLTPAYITTPLVVTDLALLLGVTVAAMVHSKPRLRRLGAATLAVASWICMSVFWMVPLWRYYGAEAVRGESVSGMAGLFRLNSAPLLDAIRLGGYWGLSANLRGSRYFPWSDYFASGHPGWVLGYLIPLLAAVGLVALVRPAREPRNHPGGWYLGFSAFFLVVVLFLVTGALAPLGAQKQQLFDVLGLAGPFRSVYQRFMAYAPLALLPFVSLGLEKVAGEQSVTPPGSAAPLLRRVGAAVLVTGVAVGAALPLWTGSLFDRSGILPSNRIQLPSSYSAVAEWLDDQEGDYSVLEMPSWPSPVQALEWQGGSDGFLGTSPLLLLSKRPVAIADPANAVQTAIAEALNADAPTTAGLALNLMNVRFVILHRDVNVEYAEALGVNEVRKAEEQIASMSSLREVLAEGHLTVYENTKWVPARFLRVRRDATSDPEMLLNTATPLPYERIGRARFAVNTSSVGARHLVVMNTPLDTEWRTAGGAAFSSPTGLTALRANGRGSLEVYHRADRQLPLLQALSAVVLAACAVAALLDAHRSKEPSARPCP